MAQAAPTPTLSTFIAQLLAPIAPPADRRAQREAKRDLEDAWSVAFHRYYAAEHLRHHLSHVARAAEVERKTLVTPEREAAAQAQLAFTGAVNALMMTPAPAIGGLRLKQKLREFAGGRDRWETAIAADVARLEKRNG